MPTQLAVSYLPLDIAARTQLAEQDTGTGGIYSRLEDLGHEVVRFTETASFRAASAVEAAFLGLADGERVIGIRRVAFDQSGVEVCDAALHPDRWVLERTFIA